MPTSVDEEAFNDLFFNRGVLSIASAGNGVSNVYNYPASYDSVMSVAAIDINNAHAYFSNTNDQVEIAAPGVNVLSTGGPSGDYLTLHGTSMAAPHVAGVALVLRNKFPDKSPQEIRSALTQGAIDLGEPGYDIKFGFGLVNYWNSEEILSPPPPACDDVRIKLRTDDYGKETSWEIVNSSGAVVASGSGYGNNKDYEENYCLPADCYTFTIFDEFGDGMCCEQGEGFYRLFFNGKRVKKGGNFGSSESTEFGDDGKSFEVFKNEKYYVLTCKWILNQKFFKVAKVCDYPDGNAGEVCTCVCA